MNEEERRKIISEDYGDGIVEFAISPEEFARFAVRQLILLVINMQRYMFLFPEYLTD